MRPIDTANIILRDSASILLVILILRLLAVFCKISTIRLEACK